MIRHLVLWKLAAESADEKAAVVAELQERFAPLVSLIDGTERLDIRADLDATDGNWDVVLDSDYRDADALDAYQVHPSHQAVVPQIKALVSQRAAVDFEL